MTRSKLKFVWIFLLLIGVLFSQNHDQDVSLMEDQEVEDQEVEQKDYFNKRGGRHSVYLSYSVVNDFIYQHLYNYQFQDSFMEHIKASGNHHILYFSYAYDYSLTKTFTLGGKVFYGGEAFNGDNVGGFDYYMLGFRAKFSWHFSQKSFDPYLGFSLGIDLHGESYVHSISFLPDLPTDLWEEVGWDVFLGVRISITHNFGVFFETAYPFPLISFGFYFG